VLILILGRFVNMAVPYFLAKLIFIFEEGVTSPPWLYLFGYVGLRFLQSSGGLSALLDVSHIVPVFLCASNLVIQFLWTPVMQYSDGGA
jgi:hypothetical protein